MALARHAWKFVCLLALVGFLAACNNNNSGDAAEKDSKETANATKPDEPATGGEAAEKVPEIANDLYPDFMLDQFTAEEKVKLVKLTKAELCPCPNANKSLDECLQKREERCELAQQVMSMIGSMVKASYNETDILDQVAQLIDAAKRQNTFNLDGRPVKGKTDAKVVIVEFADFQCPYCKEASKVMHAMMDKYGDRVAMYFKQYPLPAHEYGELAARAAIAAHRQGKFWKMHDELFKNQKSLSYNKIVSIAQRIGLNMSKFKVDVESPDVRAYVQEDRQDGEKAQLSGTPTIFINGRRFLGDGTEESLYAAIDKALRDAEKTDTTTQTN